MEFVDDTSGAPTAVRLAPEARGWPLVGVAWQMRQDPLPFMLRAMERHGDVVRMRLGQYRAHLLRNPDHIRHVFVDNAANYSKQTRGYQKARIVLGEGLVTSEGALWQRQRRIATPAFGRQRVAALAGTMVEATGRALAAWRERTRGGASIDAFAELMRLTLEIAVRTLLGIGPEAVTQGLNRAVSVVLERTNDIITNPLYPPLWVPTPKNRALKRAIAEIEGFVYAAIARRRASPNPAASDLLSLLLAARDEQTGEGMSDRQLRDEAVTILIAGHETTANVLAWAAYLLAMHPGVERRLHAEVGSAMGEREPTADDVPRLPFTRAVIEEAMRLYPPAWMIGRCAIREDVIGGYRIPAGTFALISPYVTHRHPGLWDNPEAFDPDRFIDGRAERLPKFAYLPFGGGQRFCIGATFAMTEATLLLAMITRACRLALVGGQRVEPFAMITLRPRHGIHVRAQWRD